HHALGWPDGHDLTHIQRAARHEPQQPASPNCWSPNFCGTPRLKWCVGTMAATSRNQRALSCAATTLNLGQTWGKMPRVKPPYPPKLHLETPYFLGFGLDKVAQDGGGGEIRTHGRLPVAGFQDRCLKPLGHAS